METPLITIERFGPTLVLMLNRPEARNALIPEMAEALDGALTSAEQDETVSCVILTGAGEKAFCAGVDFRHLAAHGEEGVFIADRGLAGITRRPCTKPIIAAVNGSALGGGFELVLACDLVVAVEKAIFGLPEVKVGAIAPGGGLVRLAHRVGRNVALEMVMTGNSIDATRAWQLGLVNRVVAVDTLLETALDLAQTIAQNAPFAVRTARTLVEESLELSPAQAWARNDECYAVVKSSADLKEGLQAIQAKRRPVWTGR